KLPHGHALPRPLGHLGHGHVSGAVQHNVRALDSPSRAPAASAPPAHPAADAAAPTPPEPAQHTGAAGTPASAPGTPPATPEPAPPNPGAQPVDGGAVPAWPDQQPGGGGGAVVAGAADGGGAIGAGGTPAGVAELVNSPRLSAPPDVRTFLTSGGADPRMVSVLDSALANHTIGLGPVTALSDPVHAQALSIVSVDGQPVGPGNFAARDLVTEIAALDPSLRPAQIGTPWPIHSPGFFSDPTQQGQLHLAFVSSSEPEPVSEAAPVEAAGTPTPAAAPVEAAGTPTPAAAPSPPPATSGSDYVNPLPASAHIGRTDMGVDANMNPGDPIVAPGNSRVLGITPNWYGGQPYVALQLLDGPMKGHNYYLAEQ